MESLTKASAKALARKYYKKQSLKNQRQNIPASGKVLDGAELDNMIEATLDMWLTGGRFNEEFQKDLSAYLGIKHALTVNSGSGANLLALSALMSYKLGDRKINKSDEIITVACAFPTTVAPIIQNGLVPVFVDIDINTANISANQIEAAITPKTKAVFIAHTLGNPFDLERVKDICKKHKLWLIEDACDALGSKYDKKFIGAFGDIATFSFYPAHQITMGEGGAVATDNEKLYKILLSLRDWGRDCFCPTGKDNACKHRFDKQLGKLPKGYDHKYTYSHLGYNFKITDWQAACALAQLKKLPAFKEQRQKNFTALFMGLKPYESYFILPSWDAKAEPCWFGFLMTVKESAPFNKFELCKYLEDNQIATRQLFAGNILRQPAFTEDDIALRINNSAILNSKDLTEDDFKKLPYTEQAMNASFWVGVWPGLGEDDTKKIISVISRFIETKKQ